jgi:hypothetical protein
LRGRTLRHPKPTECENGIQDANLTVLLVGRS